MGEVLNPDDAEPDYSLALASAGPSAGGFEFNLRTGIDLARHLTQSTRTLLDGSGAENYVEMRFNDSEGNEYIATFRRRSGKTPDQLRRVTEFERDKLVETIGRLTSLPPEKVAETYGVGYTG